MDRQVVTTVLNQCLGWALVGSGVSFSFGVLIQDPFWCLFPLGVGAGSVNMRVIVGKELEKIENIAQLDAIANELEA